MNNHPRFPFLLLLEMIIWLNIVAHLPRGRLTDQVPFFICSLRSCRALFMLTSAS
jgi:hypothetical protein